MRVRHYDHERQGRTTCRTYELNREARRRGERYTVEKKEQPKKKT